MTIDFNSPWRREIRKDANLATLYILNEKGVRIIQVIHNPGITPDETNALLSLIENAPEMRNLLQRIINAEHYRQCEQDRRALYSDIRRMLERTNGN